jgi:hypothetical protein
MILTEKLIHAWKILSLCLLSTKKSTWATLEPNPGFQSDRQAIPTEAWNSLIPVKKERLLSTGMTSFPPLSDCNFDPEKGPENTSL